MVVDKIIMTSKIKINLDQILAYYDLKIKKTKDKIRNKEKWKTNGYIKYATERKEYYMKKINNQTTITHPSDFDEKTRNKLWSIEMEELILFSIDNSTPQDTKKEMYYNWVSDFYKDRKHLLKIIDDRWKMVCAYLIVLTTCVTSIS